MTDGRAVHATVKVEIDMDPAADSLEAEITVEIDGHADQADKDLALMHATSRLMSSAAVAFSDCKTFEEVMKELVDQAREGVGCLTEVVRDDVRLDITGVVGGKKKGAAN